MNIKDAYIGSAVQGKVYACFVPESTTLPFMVVPDVINALLKLEVTPATNLSQVVYNIGAFSVSAKDLYDMIKKTFPIAEVNFKPDPLRKKIVDSWPADSDDSIARKGWGWSHEFDFKRAFDAYSIPAVKQRYGK